jgi:hypothetical protein
MTIVDIKVVGDESKAIAALQKVINKQGQMIDKIKKGNAELKKTGKRTQQAGSAAGDLATKVGSAVAGYASLGAAVGILRAIDEKTQAVAKNTGGLVNDLISLKSIGIDRTFTTRAAGDLARQFGLAPQQSLGLIQRLSSVTGSKEEGVRFARQAGRLKELGVGIESAENVLQLGLKQDIGPRQISRELLAAGKESSLSPAQIAQASRTTLPAFADVKGGTRAAFATLSELSAVFTDPSKLETFGRAAAESLTLGLEGTKKGKTFRALGIEDPRDIFKTLQILKEQKITSVQDLEKAGFGEKRGRTSISLLIKNLDSFIDKFEKVSAKSQEVGFLAAEEKAARSDPLIRTELQRRRALAETLFEQQLGEGAGGRVEAIGRRQQKALELTRQQRPGAFFVTPEGELSTAGAAGAAAQEIAEPLGSPIGALLLPHLQATNTLLDFIFKTNKEQLDEQKINKNKNRNVN